MNALIIRDALRREQKKALSDLYTSLFPPSDLTDDGRAVWVEQARAALPYLAEAALAVAGAGRANAS